MPHFWPVPPRNTEMCLFIIVILHHNVSCNVLLVPETEGCTGAYGHLTSPSFPIDLSGILPAWPRYSEERSRYLKHCSRHYWLIYVHLLHAITKISSWQVLTKEHSTEPTILFSPWKRTFSRNNPKHKNLITFGVISLVWLPAPAYCWSEILARWSKNTESLKCERGWVYISWDKTMGKQFDVAGSYSMTARGRSPSWDRPS